MDLDPLVALRRALHKIPECSGCETKTAEKLLEFLAPLNHHGMVTGLGGHGLALIFEGDFPGETLLFRADMDGVAVPEADSPEASMHPGVSHACGHDGHMAILCGVARWLSETPLHMGRVILLFQPAEESGAGAEAVIKDSRFQGLQPDRVFSLHNIPGEKAGRFLIPDRLFACASCGISVTVHGKPSHAARPEEGLSPAPFVAEVLADTSLFAMEEGGPFFMATLTHMALGEPGFGIAPGEAILQWTLRAHGEGYLSYRYSMIRKALETLAQERGLSLDFEIHDAFPQTPTDPETSREVMAALTEAKMDAVPLEIPMRWSEDFGHFTARWPGLMVGLGAGECGSLHTPEYAFNDDVLEVGIDFFRTIVDVYLGEGMVG